MGSWMTYGLGSENQDLPGFVALLSGGTDPEALVRLVNPKVELEEGEIREEEGCLSFPEVILTVPRPARVVVSGQNLEGKPVSIQAEGLMARCLHHEIDHLDGVLFIDRVSPLKRDMTRRRIAKDKGLGAKLVAYRRKQSRAQRA